MAGGIIFTAAGLMLRDQRGKLVTCSRCGSDQFDVTIRGDEPDQIECTMADCGKPLSQSDIDRIAEAGR